MAAQLDLSSIQKELFELRQQRNEVSTPMRTSSIYCGGCVMLVCCLQPALSNLPSVPDDQLQHACEQLPPGSSGEEDVVHWSIACDADASLLQASQRYNALKAGGMMPRGPPDGSRPFIPGGARPGPGVFSGRLGPLHGGARGGAGYDGPSRGGYEREGRFGAPADSRGSYGDARGGMAGPSGAAERRRSEVRCGAVRCMHRLMLLAACTAACCFMQCIRPSGTPGVCWRGARSMPAGTVNTSSSCNQARARTHSAGPSLD